MKRKRKEDCSSPLLDDSPKRTKVHAQRKFAQGSNVNSPVITPVQEIEKQEIPLPEPVELLPIKRPNTEDFLTFLCFRGTPMLPSKLNFFNTASIVDTNGQVHEIKSESPKNGPIDTSAITKTGTGSSERPFVAFGVRKRADPIVISRQMERKRRHALALQALRRKYQEQKMAKIRAVTISKLSEKVTHKTLVRSNSLSKSESVNKKSATVQKSKVSEVATKRVKVPSTTKNSLRPQLKQKMCLRSFRGRFIQRELQFRNNKRRNVPGKKLSKKENEKNAAENLNESSEYSSDDEKPLAKKVKTPKLILPKVAKKHAPGPKKPSEINFRITRSNKFLNNKITSRRQQIKQQLLMTSPKTTVKPRTLRSNSTQKVSLTSPKTRQAMMRMKTQKITEKMAKEVINKENTENVKVESTKKETMKKEIPKQSESTKKETRSSVAKKPLENEKRDLSNTTIKKKVEVRTNSTPVAQKKNIKMSTNIKKEQPKTVVVESKKSVPKKTKLVEPKKEIAKEESSKKEESEKSECSEARTSQRPSRKTKEAAAIYMEILSHKLVNESKIDDDNVSIDSFPELPNVKKTEQRENELKAKAKSNKDLESDNKKGKTESRTLRSSDKRIVDKKSEEGDNNCGNENKKVVEEKILKLAKKGVEEVIKKSESKSRVDEVVKKNDDKSRVDEIERKVGQKEKLEENTEETSKKTIAKSERIETTAKHVGAGNDLEKSQNKSVKKEKEETLKNVNERVEVAANEESNFKEDEKSKFKEEEKSKFKEEEKSEQQSKKGNPKEQGKTRCSSQEKMKSSSQEKLKNELKNQINPLEVDIKKNKFESKTKQIKDEKTDLNDILEPNPLKVDIKKSKSELKTKQKTDEKLDLNDSLEPSPLKVDVKKNKSESKIKQKTGEKTDLKDILEPNPLEIDIKKNKFESKTKQKSDEKTDVNDILEPNPLKDEIKKNKSESKIKQKIGEKTDRRDILEPSSLEVDIKKNKSESKTKQKTDEKTDLNDIIEPNPLKVDIKKNKSELKTKQKTDLKDILEPESSVKELISKKTRETVEILRRQTRNSQNMRHADSDDSDESYHADVKIPRKKQVTRSKALKCYESDSDASDSKTDIKKIRRTKTRSYKECSSSEFDQSLCSEAEDKPLQTMVRYKRSQRATTKTKQEQSFSDSDEEPLSNLTKNKDNGEKKNVQTATTVKEEKSDLKNEEKEGFSKPKRECAKRTQYYLPPFSSSDEDDYLLGFTEKTEVKGKKGKTSENTASLYPPTADLSYKDVGRRFGKGKVNMSNEQIEKWLKESAMAGKNESDSMMKFGDKIPTETSHRLANLIDTEKLKNLLINLNDNKQVEKKLDSQSHSKEDRKQSTTPKPILDRKLIFRNKDKVPAVPNINAFSVSNESSVYAFGEETEDVMKTPFRRPSRRPSSTATSKSEDESSKFEDLAKAGQFRKPSLLKQDQTKTSKESVGYESSEETSNLDTKSKPVQSTSVQKSEEKPTTMVPPSNIVQKLRETKTFKTNLRISEALDDARYKIPSSPSASSSSSAKLYKRQTSKVRVTEIVAVKLPEFPKGSAQLVEAPTFYPSDKEFQDPLEYIEKIKTNAEQFGICRIVPPSTFKPECKVTDDMRFTAYNQYVHKMLHRWGPNFKELMAIKKYLSTQNITLTHPPWIGGMEIDLPRLYQTVQSLGGLKEVIEKKKWFKVSDAMKIPRSAQDRVTKLDDIYCKYLLPYDTLSPAEREKLFDEVETEWAKRESKSLMKAQQNVEEEENDEESESDNEAEECIVKGRNMALNAFYRIARNTMSMWFKTAESPAEEVEQEFWKHVTLKYNHICVHSGSIDSGSWGYGFAVSKNSPFARHAWNLKVLTNNSGSVLRSMGPVMGVTVPTLHVGMVFSSCCWYRDPHSLPWIEYLHTGGSKIWYGIPSGISEAFHITMKKLVPNYCRNKTLWLPSDTVMVPPSLLVENGVSLCRIVQEPGQFIVVFPKVFTSSLSTGYVVSESVYFAPPYWLQKARTVFNDLRNSCEPSMFSLDRLLLSIVNDARSNIEVLKQIIPAVKELCDKELVMRSKIKSLGVSDFEKLPLPEAPNVRKKKKLQGDDGEYECEICRMSLFISMIIESQDGGVYCLEHAIEEIEKEKILSKNCKLMYTYDDEELKGLEGKIKASIANKMQRKVPNKYAGMPTLLNK